MFGLQREEEGAEATPRGTLVGSAKKRRQPREAEEGERSEREGTLHPKPYTLVDERSGPEGTLHSLLSSTSI